VSHTEKGTPCIAWTQSEHTPDKFPAKVCTVKTKSIMRPP